MFTLAADSTLTDHIARLLLLELSLGMNTAITSNDSLMDEWKENWRRQMLGKIIDEFPVTDQSILIGNNWGVISLVRRVESDRFDVTELEDCGNHPETYKDALQKHQKNSKIYLLPMENSSSVMTWLVTPQGPLCRQDASVPKNTNLWIPLE